MGSLADDWGEHIRTSPITNYVVHAALTHDGSFTVDLAQVVTEILGEISVLHQQVLRMCQTLDEVQERLDASGA